MKKITVLAMAFMAVGMFSCQNGAKNGEADLINATVESIGTDDACLPTWASDAKMVTWDDTFNSTEVTVATLDTVTCQLRLADTAAPQGIRRFVYPASAYAGQGVVTVPAIQQGPSGLDQTLCYAELQEGKADFKNLCGAVMLNATTPEHLTSITFITSDSNRYLAGNFQVANYPFPVLNAVEGAVQQVTVQGIEDLDFSEGADLCIQVAPGCYNSFQIVLQNKEGKTCTKTLKADKHVVIDRNRVLSITLGGAPEELVFE